MTTNRRTIRITILTAIFVLLLAGIVGELTFGSNGSVRSAQAEVATRGGVASALVVDDGAVSAGFDLGAVGAADESANAPDQVPSVETVMVTVPSTASSTVGSEVPSVQTFPGAETVPAVVSTDPSQSPDITGRCSAQDDEDHHHAHCVDDHAVEHSDRHGPDEAEAHGHDEEAHQEHRS
jgi:hypothetical protein